MSEPGQPTLATLVYARRPDGSVLLRHRRRPPFCGQWVAPGGKIEPNESPVDCAQREFQVETGLNALDLKLRAVIREVSPRADFDWLLFLYRCCAAGSHHGESLEGEVRWWGRNDLEHAVVPAGDRWWLPHVLGENGRLLEATIHYDAALAITGIEQAQL